MYGASQGPITRIINAALDSKAGGDCGLEMARKLLDAVPGTVTQENYAKFCSSGVSYACSLVTMC